MDKWVRRILVVLVVGFLLFFLFTRPESAADIVKGVVGAFDSVFRFFAQLVR